MNVTLLGAGVLIVYLIIGTVVTGGLQVYLAGRKSKGWGLILPALSLVFTMFIVGTTAFACVEVTPWDNSTGYDGDELSMRFDYVYGKDGRVAAFSDLRLIDRTTGKKYVFPMAFDDNGELIGNKEAMKYKDYVETILREQKFVGNSVSKEDLRRIYMKHHLSEYAPLLFYLLISLVPFIVHTAIYVAVRKRIRRRSDAQALKEMKIADL